MSLETIKRNKRLEGVFNRAASTYDTIGPRYFSYLGRQLAQYAKIKQGSTVLDVACGRGASLFPAIEMAGEEGQVIGIDFSQEMVKETQLQICSKGLCNSKVLQMDAEMLDFPDNSFDYVLCGLSTAFFSNSLAAVGEMHRVLNANGRLGVSTWKNREKKGILEKAYTSLFPQIQHTNLNNIAGRPDFGSEDGVRNILTDIGFKNIEVFIENKTFYYRDEEEWWQEQWTNASRGLFEHVQSLGEDAIEKFKETVFGELIEYKDENGIRLEADILFSFANK